jgi:hypothetical protein
VLLSTGVLWLVTVISTMLAAMAWRKARATARRLEQVSQMYWELKYQHGELRVQVQRLNGGQPGETRPGGTAADVEPTRPADGFIPLSSLKR